ncbi:MAG: MFS transporter, partial [Dehalococcoidia bacterium]|nr:MFS transporter [Dehalococcoidia bacterium]
GSPFWLGMMVFFHWIPTTIFALFAGVLADRLDNRKLILFCECLFLTSSLGMAILTISGTINVWEISGLLLLHGMAAAISNPNRQIFVHDIVGKDKLMSAVGLNNSLFQCMQFGGPALTGILIASIGPGLTYVVNTIAFVPAIIIMSLIRYEKPHREPSHISRWESLRVGLRHVRNKPLLLSLIAMTTLPAFLLGEAMSSMMPIFATDVLHVGAQGMGFLVSANGLGAISAAIFISYVGNFRHKGLLIIASSLAYGAILIAFSGSSWFVVSLLLLVAAGVVAVTSNTLINTAVQLAAPDEVRGRVMGVYSLGNLGVRSFNGPVIGSFAAAAGAPIALAVLGGLVAISVVVITVLSPETRRLD